MAADQSNNNTENLSDMVFTSEFLSSDMDITDSSMDPFQTPPLAFHQQTKRDWPGRSSPPPPAPPDHLFYSIPSPSVPGLKEYAEEAPPPPRLPDAAGQRSPAHLPPRHPYPPVVAYGGGYGPPSSATVAGDGRGGGGEAWRGFGRPHPPPGRDSAPSHVAVHPGADKYPLAAPQPAAMGLTLSRPMPSQGYDPRGEVGMGSGGGGVGGQWPMTQFWSSMDQRPGSSSMFHMGGRLDHEEEEDQQKEQSDKRRLDRNSREQKRSKRISDQIKELKTLLEVSGVNMTKGNKSSVLTCAAEYIMDLQQRMDAAGTRRGARPSSTCAATATTATMSSSASSTAGSTTSGGSGSSVPSSGASVRSLDSADSSSSPLGRSINYRRVFHDQSVPVAITAVDGRFIDCNWRFERESGLSKDQLRGMTFFSLVAPGGEHGSVFQTVAHMLKDTSRQPREVVVRAVLGHRGTMEERLMQLSTIFADDPEDHEVKYFSCALLPATGSPRSGASGAAAAGEDGDEAGGAGYGGAAGGGSQGAGQRKARRKGGDGGS